MGEGGGVSILAVENVEKGEGGGYLTVSGM